MTPTATTHDASKTRRIELILRQIDALPTLPAVAMRLLQLTSDDESESRAVIETVKSDQALTANILGMCRRADAGVRADTLTIDKAVLLLGYNAVRNAVLSLKVLEVFDREGEGEREKGNGNGKGDAGGRPEPPASAGGCAPSTTFDRTGFWRHCLAVGTTAELIAQAHKDAGDLNPGEAFVCGLLHDVGKLALDFVLPKAFDRVAELVELNQGNIAEFERRIVGIDHHTAGKRLAEQWQLPHVLQDVIWLHGSPYDMLPKLDHKRMVGLISLADLIARRHHLGYSGNYAFKQEPAELAEQIGLDPRRVEEASARVHEELQKREQLLGLGDRPSHELFLESIQRANQMLGRLNAALDRRSRAAARQQQVLDAIATFHNTAGPGQGVQDALQRVAASAAGVLGNGFYATLYQPNVEEPWLVCKYNAQGEAQTCHYVEAPPSAPDLTTIDANHPSGLNTMSILPWVSDYLIDAEDMRDIRMLPIGCAWGTVAILVHDRPVLPPWQQLSALTTTWGSAIAAVRQHEGARRLSEQLAEANSALADAHERLLQAESLSRLGEMAAGAAHEMNNPLAIISGRAQLLVSGLKHGSGEHKAAAAIFEQAHRLSDLITALRLWADPPKPEHQRIDPGELLNSIVSRFIESLAGNHPPVYLQIKHDLPLIEVDPEMITKAVTHLLLNAVQAGPKTSVQITGRVNRPERELIIQVADDGPGMDAHTLSHAMDPFFSAKKAGRLVGMGLPSARQLVAVHHGRVELRSSQGEGTVASIILPLDSSQ
jgi:signal transduction histidine kinase/HD-like signal output (HDOD) protein